MHLVFHGHPGKRHLLAGAWRERTYGVGQHGARCLPVHQMIDLACRFALVNCHIMVN